MFYFCQECPDKFIILFFNCLKNYNGNPWKITMLEFLIKYFPNYEDPKPLDL